MMESNIWKNIYVKKFNVDVANAVHISSYHFQRAFTLLSGMTIQACIRNRRLSLAGEDLLNPETKVIDIALKYGYESIVSFTKALCLLLM